jgi:hypothetical protein
MQQWCSAHAACVPLLLLIIMVLQSGRCHAPSDADARAAAAAAAASATQGLINSSEERTAEAGLLIMADLAAYSTDHLRPHLAGLHPLLATTLNSPSLDVQVRLGQLPDVCRQGDACGGHACADVLCYGQHHMYGCGNHAVGVCSQ